MALVFDYSDGRAMIQGKPLQRHLLPEYIPQKERQTIQCVKVRQGGRVIRCLEIDGETIKLQAI